MVKINCICCKKEIISRTRRRKFCNNKCQFKYRYNIPELKARLKAYSAKYVDKVKHTSKYKLRMKLNFSRWYSRPENKLKMKLYGRIYQRKKLNISPDRFRKV